MRRTVFVKTADQLFQGSPDKQESNGFMDQFSFAFKKIFHHLTGFFDQPFTGINKTMLGMRKKMNKFFENAGPGKFFYGGFLPAVGAVITLVQRTTIEAGDG